MGPAAELPPGALVDARGEGRCCCKTVTTLSTQLAAASRHAS